MTSIAVDKQPVIINDKNIVEFKVSELNFIAFHKVYMETSSIAPNGGKAWAMQNRRLRIKKQVRAVDDGGNEHLLDDMSITQMPVVYTNRINNALNETGGKPGEVVNTGDGISSPILYRLGTPIKGQIGGEVSEITELEFMATVYGDIEEVLAETDQIGQTAALIRSVAKPLGMNDMLQRLPEWGLDRITLADGFKISEEILPRFLE